MRRRSFPKMRRFPEEPPTKMRPRSRTKPGTKQRPRRASRTSQRSRAETAPAPEQPPAEPNQDEATKQYNSHQKNHLESLEPSRGSPSYPSQPRLASGVTHSPSCAAPRTRGWGLFTLLSAGPAPTVIPVYAVESQDGRVLLLLLCGGGSFFFVVVLIEP